MIRPKLQRVASGTRLTTDLVNAIINRTEYAADILRQYKLIAGNQMYVEPHYDGTRVSYYYPVGGGATPKGSPITIPPNNSYTPFNLTWSVAGNACIQNPWVISNSGYSIRVNIADSENCGGNCSIQQAASAQTLFNTGNDILDLYISGSGIVEQHTLGYDGLNVSVVAGTFNKRVLRLDSPGGGLQCIMGPARETYLVNSPYRIPANTNCNIILEMNTGDNLFHVGAYFNININFIKI